MNESIKQPVAAETSEAVIALETTQARTEETVALTSISELVRSGRSLDELCPRTWKKW